jgi:hypothetical protein
MECRQCSRELRQWLERGWEAGPLHAPPGLSPSLAAHAAACPRCAPRVEAARLLLQGEVLKAAPPPELAARVSRRLLAHPVSGVRGGAAARGWRTRRSPIRSPWVLLPVAAVLAVALGVSVLFGLVLRRPADTVVVRFVLQAPGARQVALVGDWNRWDPEAQKLRDPDGDGVWELEVRLKRGQEQRYQFLIDGERWVADPEAPLKVEDAFGGMSSVLQI